MTTAWLGLGSDLGERVAWLRRGMRELQSEGLRTGARSSLYLTEPVGNPELPWFVNCVVEVIDPPEPYELLRACRRVERRCGRMRRPGPSRARTLDVDVLLYDHRVIEHPDLWVPHPRMHLRRFVLEPLAEIAPRIVHPRSGRRIGQMLAELESDERVWLLAPPLAADAG